MPTEAPRFLLVYSSQTGQAQAIAEEIAEQAPSHGLHADLHCISNTEKRFWLERERHAVIITSTTGDGDVPDTGHKFWRRLKRKTHPPDLLTGLRFALLGLGDSNYANFCNCGKTFYRRLSDLGAVAFYDPAWADDAVGLEVAVEPWIEGLWPTLRKELVEQDTDAMASTDAVSNDAIDSGGGENSGNTSIPVGGQVISDSIPGERRDSAVGHSGELSGGDRNSYTREIDQVDQIKLEQTDSSAETTNSKPTVGMKTPLQQGSDDLTQTQSSPARGAVTEQKNGPVDAVSGSVSSPSQGTSEEQSAGEGDTGDSQGETLVRSCGALAESALTLPVLPAAYLSITFDIDSSKNAEQSQPYLQNGSPFPSAKTSVTMATITRAVQLTQDNAVKKTLKLTLQVKNLSWDWGPGDSFGIICPNPCDEVEALIQRLGLSDVCDQLYTLEVIPGTKKRNAAVPAHIPPSGTIRDALLHCCDIRAAPKKALLRCLVEYCASPEEKRRLQELCSKQGAESYASYIREVGISLLDLLMAFPSCQPPLARLLEHLPRLQPRPYSAASSPTANADEVDFVFNVIEIPAGLGRSQHRRGICTGHLDLFTTHLQALNTEELSGQMEQLSIDKLPLQVPVYLRQNQHFRPSDDLKRPLVMIGPGTGVAPFIGFLQHREHLLTEIGDPDSVGECWLFFGCRHKDRDYIFREQLEGFHQRGVLHKLLVCFSREPEDGLRYVQHVLERRAKEVVHLIEERQAYVYVCGDARGMARDVANTFNQILQEQKGWTKSDTDTFLKKMRLSGRYQEDVWT